MFDSLMKEHLENYKECSPIRRILIGDENKTIQFAEALKDRGILVPPSMFPSVEKGKAILRGVLSAVHSEGQIRELAKQINEIIKGV